PGRVPPRRPGAARAYRRRGGYDPRAAGPCAGGAPVPRTPSPVLLACTALAACALAAPGRAADPAPEGKPSPVHEDARIAPVPWTIPPPGSCAPSGGARVLPKGDAPPTAFRPGDTFSFEELGALRDFLPPFLWEYRERFFQPGMRLEIGRCFADYGPPDFYLKATGEHAGEARLTAAGGIENYTSGLPF